MRKFIAKLLSYVYMLRYGKITFSQEGEDLIIRNVFKGKRDGFFVDVGAHHPIKLSNTAYMSIFWGWTGINIDARPGSMKLFGVLRSNDISLERGVSDQAEELGFYLFDKPEYGTFALDVTNRSHNTKPKLVGTHRIATSTLTEILDEVMTPGKHIDLLSIDAEGYDYKIVKSLDFAKYKPRLVIVEDPKFSFANRRESKVYELLMKNGYQLYAKTIRSLYFLRRRSAQG
jgi:hypothetical protein